MSGYVLIAEGVAERGGETARALAVCERTGLSAFVLDEESEGLLALESSPATKVGVGWGHALRERWGFSVGYDLAKEALAERGVLKLLEHAAQGEDEEHIRLVLGQLLVSGEWESLKGMSNIGGGGDPARALDGVAKTLADEILSMDDMTPEGLAAANGISRDSLHASFEDAMTLEELARARALHSARVLAPLVQGLVMRGFIMDVDGFSKLKMPEGQKALG